MSAKFKDWFWSGASLMQNKGDHSDRIMRAATLPSDEAANLIVSAPDLRDALRGMLPHVFTNDPSDADMVAHWQREHGLGNGQAAKVLAAYAALAKANGGA